MGCTNGLSFYKDKQKRKKEGSLIDMTYEHAMLLAVPC